MEEISINITIGKRQYPLKIRRSDEERIRKAEKMLNERITQYEKQYAASDKQDILNMCAFQFASELVNFTDDHRLTTALASDAILTIDKIITDSIRQNSVH